jgi:hypothetical protein
MVPGFTEARRRRLAESQEEPMDDTEVSEILELADDESITYDDE